MPARRPGSTNRVRLIGGAQRGRWLRFPDAPGLRPTADRVRETLFNWLQPYMAGAVCLDLFAGSGAIGFEALSRGAARVLMVEREPSVVEALRHSRSELAFSGAEIQQADALDWLPGCEERFDLVFLDPPFADGLQARILAMLMQQALLKPGGLIYLEMDASAPLLQLPSGLDIHRDKRAGQVRYCLLRGQGR
jgi:16S rRNA (guanine966-N2)-methyltransferase